MSALHEKLSFTSPVKFLNDRTIGKSQAADNIVLRDRLKNARNLFVKDIKGHFGCINAIEFSHTGNLIASGGDDMRVLLWNTERAMDDACTPIALKGLHHSNIFSLAFDSLDTKIFSGGNDEQVIVHDIKSGQTLDVYTHNEAVYGISGDPFCDSVFASACDDGRVLIYDIRAPSSEEPFCLANYMSAMHAVMFNPVEPRLVATANNREGIGLWDIRKPRTCLLRYGGSLSQQSCMSVRISSDGKRIIGLRRRLPPVLYDIHSSKAVFQFDHSGYYNSCTMKSCCFAGDKDQYLISGSDDFNLYVWKIPEEDADEFWVSEAHLVLKGHRSIVNQVRFNPSNHLIISSGVEKVIKMWSPYGLRNSSGDLGDGSSKSERTIFTHEEYIHLVLNSGQIMSHDYSTQSTDEDPRMIAFFDSLVQRELENWSSSDESVDFTGGAIYNPSYLSSPSPSRDEEDEAQFSSPSVSEPPSILIPFEVSPVRNTNEASDSEVTRRGLSASGVDGQSNNDESHEEPFFLDMDTHNINRTSSYATPTNGYNATWATERSSNTSDAGTNCTNSSNSSSSSSLNTTLNSSLDSSSNATLNSNSDFSACTSSSNTSIASNSSSSTASRSSTQTNISSTSSNTSGVFPASSSRESSADRMQPIRRRVRVIQGENSTVTSQDSGFIENRPNSDERLTSISSLVKLKRTEYLNGIKKLEQKAIRRKLLLQEKRKEKIKRIRKARLVESAESDTSDSETDTSQVLPNSAQGLVNDAAPQNGVEDLSTNVLRELASDRCERLRDTERLKQLRSRVLEEEDSAYIPPVQKSCSLPSPSPLDLTKSANSTPDTTYSNHASDVHSHNSSSLQKTSSAPENNKKSSQCLSRYIIGIQTSVNDNSAVSLEEPGYALEAELGCVSCDNQNTFHSNVIVSDFTQTPTVGEPSSAVQRTSACFANAESNGATNPSHPSNDECSQNGTDVGANVHHSDNVQNERETSFKKMKPRKYNRVYRR